MVAINGKTTLIGIIGWPVAHSLSPAMHNAAFAALDLNWAYLPLPVRPAQLPAALEGLVALHFAGANVTVPHKEAVLPYLASRSRAAEVIGAVNTLIIRPDGTLHGDNSDAEGFRRDLAAQTVTCRGELPFDAWIARQTALVIGAGGAARAVVYALVESGARVIVLNRHPGRAAALTVSIAKHFPGHWLRNGRWPDDLPSAAQAATLIVNATSLGMTPAVELSPWPDEVPLRRGQILYDLVYAPEHTRFLAQGEAAGALAISGLGMLVQQGAIAFRQWTGEEPPVKAMEQAVRHALRRGRREDVAFRKGLK